MISQKNCSRRFCCSMAAHAPAGGSGAAADGVKESGWEKTLGLTSVEREKEQRKRKSMPMV